MIFNHVVINYVLLVIALFGVIFTVRNILALQREKNRLGFMQLSIDVDHINDVMDKFVESCFSEYLAYNPQLNGELYINAAMERQMVEEVTKICSERLSPVLFDKISLCYAADSIGEILSRKVYMRVTIYELDHESYKREEIEKQNAYKESLPESN